MEPNRTTVLIFPLYFSPRVSFCSTVGGKRDISIFHYLPQYGGVYVRLLFCTLVFFLSSSVGQEKLWANPTQNPTYREPGTELWNRSVAVRIKEELSAPSTLKYVQYELDSSGAEKSREQGVWTLTYDANGLATIQVVEAQKDGKNFTEERKRRLNRSRKNASRMLDILSPFDSSAQSALELGPSVEKLVDGRMVREYPFKLPQEDRKMVGFAWVDPLTGNPLGFQYTITPLPWFVDKMEVLVWFDVEFRPGLFREIQYSFAASFLVFSWIGGGTAWPSDWIRLPIKPKFGS